GQISQVQFWDTNPATGPADHWTIHGLWPDHCDGTWDQFCDPSREYPSITQVLQNNGKQALLDDMNQWWLDQNGNNEQFWEHEWNKHGTCMSTIEPSCLPPGSQTGLDAAYYFQRAVDTFKSLPTYQYLATAGITPSTSATYTYTTLANAIKASTGFTPSLDCTSGALNSVSYYFNLKGSLIDGTLVPIDAPSQGSCPTSGIKYPPKSGGASSTTTSSGPAPTGVPARSNVKAITSSGSTVGCLLSYGTWSTQTCATLTASTSGSGFTLTSSKGPCAVTSSGLSCSSTNTATVFTSTTSGSNILLTYSGSTAFTADSVPSGTTQVTLYPGSDRAQDITLAFFAV
ncbi:ribonuclease T2-like, partial [Tulasnella sp. 403]